MTKSNSENCKNCSSKCAYDCAQLQYTQNSSDNLCQNTHLFQQSYADVMLQLFCSTVLL